MNAGGMPKTCKSYEGAQRSLSKFEKLAWIMDLNGIGSLLSGKRVSNTWVTYLQDGDNDWKRSLIPDVVYGLKEPLKLRLRMGLRCIS